MHLGIDFFKILVYSGGQVKPMRPPKRPRTPQLGAQDGPEAAQETPKTAQEPPKSCLNSFQEAARRCLGTSFCPRAAQEAPRAPLDFDFAQFFQLFWIILEGFFPQELPKKSTMIQRTHGGGNAALPR